MNTKNSEKNKIKDEKLKNNIMEKWKNNEPMIKKNEQMTIIWKTMQQKWKHEKWKKQWT